MAAAAGAGAGGGGGRGGGGGAPALPTIGPQGRGSILVAWNPVTQKEAWRGPSGSSSGFNAGGTLATAGNLVFTNVANRLLAFKADTGEQVLDLATGVANPGPPMTFMIDGKQYIAIAGSIGGGGGGGGGGGWRCCWCWRWCSWRRWWRPRALLLQVGVPRLSSNLSPYCRVISRLPSSARGGESSCLTQH